MTRDADTVKVGASDTLSWPRSCVLCLSRATDKDVEIGGGNVPYCRECYARVTRFRNWKSRLSVPAVWAAVIAGVLFLANIARQEGWQAIEVRRNLYGAFMVGALAMFAVWMLMWVLVPFLPLVFPGKLARVGVHATKGREPDVRLLRFSNHEYAHMFREANGLQSEEAAGGGE
jgi:uncharacterized membrane protein